MQAIIFTFFILSALCMPGTARVLSNHYSTIICMVQDSFNVDELFICAHRSVKKMDVESLSFTDVAGINNIKGYAEGVGDQARFTIVEDILQINSTTVIATDYQNHCLRQVSGRLTSTYAGNCTERGATDGDLSEARFYGPVGLVQVGTIVYLIEGNNRRIRIIDLVERRVSTFVTTSIYAPLYIGCHQPCDILFFTLLNGVASIKRSNKDSKLLVGLSPSPNFDDHFFFNETMLVKARDILVHNERFIFVADKDNNRVLLLDLQLKMSQVVARVFRPWSLHIRDDRLLIGTEQTGIYMTNMQHTYAKGLTIRNLLGME